MAGSVLQSPFRIELLHMQAREILACLRDFFYFVSREQSTDPDDMKAHVDEGRRLAVRMERALAEFRGKRIEEDPFEEHSALPTAAETQPSTSLHDQWVRLGWAIFRDLTCVALDARLYVEDGQIMRSYLIDGAWEGSQRAVGLILDLSHPFPNAWPFPRNNSPEAVRMIRRIFHVGENHLGELDTEYAVAVIASTSFATGDFLGSEDEPIETAGREQGVQPDKTQPANNERRKLHNLRCDGQLECTLLDKRQKLHIRVVRNRKTYTLVGNQKKAFEFIMDEWEAGNYTLEFKLIRNAAGSTMDDMNSLFKGGKPGHPILKDKLLVSAARGWWGFNTDYVKTK